MKEQLPHGRGYDTSFGYLQGMNDYWKMTAGGCKTQHGEHIVDLWDTDKPAVGYNNTGKYEELIFAEKVYDIINNHNSNGDRNKLFLVYTPHIVHDPYEVPKEYYNKYKNDENMCSSTKTEIYPGFNTSNVNNYHCRSIYQSMVNLMDIIIGNITNLLKINNLYNDTLIIFTGDNGGPIAASNGKNANNFPLRGGKFVSFEGGIRTATIISGGYLPKSRRGQIENGMIHITDWYSTFCALNDIDPDDKRAKKAGLPPIDSMNMWPMISGENLTSPRYEIYVDNNTLIQGNYKLINDTNINFATWTGYVYPNSSTPLQPVDGVKLDCKSSACLFDVVNDMTEHNNIANDNNDIVDRMLKRLDEVKQGFYENNEKGFETLCPSNVSETNCSCWMAFNYYNGFYGPYETLDT